MAQEEPGVAEFYSGLIAELYEPLAGGIGSSERFIRFVRKGGEPALEVGCGTGLPMLDLLAAGLEVEGLDASADMLSQCRSRAMARNLNPTLYLGMMQNFRISQRYRSIYIPHGSITLLEHDQDLDDTFTTLAAHLLPGGRLLIDLDCPDLTELAAMAGSRKEKVLNDELLAVTFQDVSVGTDNRTAEIGLFYERTRNNRTESLYRKWHRRFWPCDEFMARLEQAGYEEISAKPAGEQAFVIRATYPGTGE